MDTLTHALSGALVARLLCARAAPGMPALSVPLPSGAAAAPGRRGTPGRFAAAWDGGAGALSPWQAVTVGFVAAAFPDIDALALLAGDMAYLRHHRGITHSVLLAPLWALGIAWLMRWAFASLRRQEGGWKALYPVALGALLLHIAGDWITQFGTMMLAPLSDARFGLGAMFIIDLPFTGLLVAGLVLAAIWPHRRWPAALGLVAASAWVGLAWMGKQEAEAVGERYARARGITVESIETMPRPASPFNWTVTVFDGRQYHVANVNTRRSEPVLVREGDHFIRRLSAPYQPAAQVRWETVTRFGGPEAPAWVREAWEHEVLAVYRWFAQTPALLQAGERVAADGTRERCAVFRDLRFEFPGRADSPFHYGVCLRDPQGRQGRLVRLDGDRLRPV